MTASETLIYTAILTSYQKYLYFLNIFNDKLKPDTGFFDRTVFLKYFSYWVNPISINKEVSMIQFSNVTKSFEKQTILKDLNFTIESGELVTLIGESGCGKTTTLKMINRLLEPTSGQILIDGKDIMSENLIQLRRSMGYVIQSTGLFPHMTIRQNIELIE
ncbi:hypothetical protein RUMHYD_02637, partial [Blautia hydrogenotrophica DSM 10507]